GSVSGTLNGGSGTNTLVAGDGTNVWTITGANAGNVSNGTSTVAFASMQALTGGAGSDTFKLGSAGSVTGRLDGGGGTNTLDDSGKTTAVSVNLQTLTATGTGGF